MSASRLRVSRPPIPAGIVGGMVPRFTDYREEVMNDPQAKMEEAVRAFKERLMSADPSLRERAKDPGFVAKWDVAVRWRLRLSPSSAPAVEAKANRDPRPERMSDLLRGSASRDTKGRPDSPLAGRVRRKTPSVSRLCVHGMERMNCAYCSRGRFPAPIKFRRW